MSVRAPAAGMRRGAGASARRLALRPRAVRRLRADDPQRCRTRFGDGSGSSRGATMRSGSVGGSASAFVRASVCRPARRRPGEGRTRVGRVASAAGSGEPVACTGTTFVRHARCVGRRLLGGAGRLGRNDRQRQGRRVHRRGLRCGPRPGRRSPQDRSAEPDVRCRWRPAPQTWCRPRASRTVDTAFPVAACANEPGTAGRSSATPPVRSTTGSVSSRAARAAADPQRRAPAPRRSAQARRPAPPPPRPAGSPPLSRRRPAQRRSPAAPRLPAPERMALCRTGADCRTVPARSATGVTAAATHVRRAERSARRRQDGAGGA